MERINSLKNQSLKLSGKGQQVECKTKNTKTKTKPKKPRCGFQSVTCLPKVGDADQ